MPKFLHNSDFGGYELLNPRLQHLAADPGSGNVSGRLYYHSGNNRPMWHDGTQYHAIHPSSQAATANLVARRNGDGTLAGDILGNAATATKWINARTITLGTDLTGNTSIDGSANVTLNATIANGAVTLAKMANIATARLLGRVSAGSGVVEELTAAQVKSLLAIGIADVSGLQTALDGKASVSHTHDASALVSGTLAAARLPAFSGDVSSTAGSASLSVLRVRVGANVQDATITDTVAGLRCIHHTTGSTGYPTEFGGGIEFLRSTADASARGSFTLWCANNLANEEIYWRMRDNAGAWGAWRNLWHSGNFTPGNYLPLTGGTLSGSLVVGGNLTVNGTTTTVNSTVVTIDDPVFTLGGDTPPGTDDGKDRGIEFHWHTGSAARVGFFGFDRSTSKLVFIPDATNTDEVFSGSKGTLDAHIEWADVLSKPSPTVTVNLTGDVTGSGNGTLTSLGNATINISTTAGAPTIADNSLSLAKLAQIAGKRVLGNASASTANVTAVKLTHAEDIGGATSVVVTHNLNTRDVLVGLRETASPYEVVIADIEITSLNTVTVKFATAPAAGAYRCIVVGF